MNILDTQVDHVISGMTSIASSTYEYAFEHLIHLIDKTDFQRNLQNKKFYKKLERDIETGCVMPPITIAFVTDEITLDTSQEQISQFVSQNIGSSFVLDGIQRLNTLSRLQESNNLNRSNKLYINIVFCKAVEKLLYRMITLNNGQRPMTPRHQVEIIMSQAFNFEELGIEVTSEKEDSNSKNTKAFKKSDIVQAYLAFMAESPMIDNKKIIEEKMDELLVGKIMEVDPSTYESEFKDVISALAKFQNSMIAHKWLNVTNNLVGFSVGMKDSSTFILSLSIDEFEQAVKRFDAVFREFNPSRIKVGKYRRELSCEYFRGFEKYREFDEDDLLQVFSELTDV